MKEILQFRRAAIDDVDALSDLLATLYEDPVLRIPASRLADMLGECDAIAGYEVWLACIATRIVGTFSLIVFPTLASGGAREAVVEAVAVAPAMRDRGIGSAMMRHAMRCAARAGCRKLVLSSNLSRVDAHRFYQRLGFEQHGWSFMVRTTTAAKPRDEELARTA